MLGGAVRRLRQRAQIISTSTSSPPRTSGPDVSLVLLLPTATRARAPSTLPCIERFLTLCAGQHPGNCNDLGAVLPPCCGADAPGRAQATGDLHPEVAAPARTARPKVDELTSGTCSRRSRRRARVAGVAAEDVTRAVFASGKVTHDAVVAHELGAAVAVGRVEQLYPWPFEQVAGVSRYPNARESSGSREEPENMGSWNFVKGRFTRPTARPPRDPPAVNESGSPATGKATRSTTRSRPPPAEAAPPSPWTS